MNPSLIQVLPDLALVPPSFVYIIIGVLGAIIGSFLNVVIHRLPLEESIVFPNSRCPACGATIAFYDNVPLVSYLMLRGKCRGCQKLISPRYPAVELLTGLLFIAVCWRDGLTLVLPFDSFCERPHRSGFMTRHMILPNAILPGMVCATAPAIRISWTTIFRRPRRSNARMFSDLRFGQGRCSGIHGALVGGGFAWLMAGPGRAARH